jgi:outer membrane usher protein
MSLKILSVVACMTMCFRIFFCFAILFFSKKSRVYASEFETSFMVGNNTANGSHISPYSIPRGGYLIELHVLSNSRKLISQLIYPIDDSYCFDRKGVELWDLAVPLEVSGSEVNDCIDISKVIPGIEVDVNLKKLTGYVKIPNNYIANSSAESAKWDYGVAGMFLTYTSNVVSTRTSNDNIFDINANVESGVNLSNWQIRHSGFYNDHTYEMQSMYFKTDLDRYRSSLFLGEISASPSLLDGFSFLGVKVASDIAMRPQKSIGNKSRVFGLAETSANVKLLSNDRVVYQSIVSPGVFYIDDIKRNGLLEMVIEEADGAVKRSTIPDSSMDGYDEPQYELSIGKYSGVRSNEPLFALGNYQFRVNEYFDLSIGGVVSDGYIGAGVDNKIYTRVGNFYVGSVLSLSNQEANNHSEILQGYKVRIAHNKHFSDSLTYITTSYNKNLNAKYLSFPEYTRIQSYIQHNNGGEEKDRFDISLNQATPNGSLFIRGGLQRSVLNIKSKNYHVGYNHKFIWGGISASLIRQSRENQDDNSFMLTVDYPLDINGYTRLSTSISKGDNEYGNMHTSLSGSYGALQQNLYHVSESKNISGPTHHSYAASLHHKTKANEFGLGLSHGDNYEKQYLSVKGSILMVNRNMFFNHDHPETIAIVSAKGAEGALINGNIQVAINDNGNAIHELTPYMDNTLSIEHDDTDYDIDVENGRRITSPRRGAIIVSDFKVTRNHYVLLKIADERISFGASVLNHNNDLVTQVAQGGLIYVNTKEKKLKIQLENGKWCHVTNTEMEHAKKNVDFNKYQRPVSVSCS